MRKVADAPAAAHQTAVSASEPADVPWLETIKQSPTGRRLSFGRPNKKPDRRARLARSEGLPTRLPIEPIIKRSPDFKQVDYCKKCQSAEWTWRKEQAENKTAAKP